MSGLKHDLMRAAIDPTTPEAQARAYSRLHDLIVEGEEIVQTRDVGWFARRYAFFLVLGFVLGAVLL